MLDCSILIPCYNANRHLAQCLESAIGQGAKEIILIDDGSTDNSLSIANRYADRGVTVISHENIGVQATRNQLLGMATGEWLQCLDADDVLMEGKISRQLESVTVDDDALYCNMIIERWRGETLMAVDHWDTGIHPTLLEAMIRWEFIPQTNCFLFRRSAMALWDESYNHCHEFKLVLDMMRSGCQFRHTPIDGVVYRRGWHRSQVTSDPALLKSRLRFQGELFEWVRHFEWAQSPTSKWSQIMAFTDRRLQMELSLTKGQQ